MPVVTIRVEEAVHHRLKMRAANASLSLSEFLRPVIEDVAFPGGRYLFTGNDELLGIAIQSYAIMVEFIAEQSPGALNRGTANAKLLMRDRRLVDPDIDPFAELGAGMDDAAEGER